MKRKKCKNMYLVKSLRVNPTVEIIESDERLKEQGKKGVTKRPRGANKN